MILDKLPTLKIGRYTPRFPVIQGGMGVLISGPSLSGAVAAEGGIGTLATVGIGMATMTCNVDNFFKKNVEALKDFVAKAREKAKESLRTMQRLFSISIRFIRAGRGSRFPQRAASAVFKSVLIFLRALFFYDLLSFSRRM